MFLTTGRKKIHDTNTIHVESISSILKLMIERSSTAHKSRVIVGCMLTDAPLSVNHLSAITVARLLNVCVRVTIEGRHARGFCGKSGSSGRCRFSFFSFFGRRQGGADTNSHPRKKKNDSNGDYGRDACISCQKCEERLALARKKRKRKKKKENDTKGARCAQSLDSHAIFTAYCFFLSAPLCIVYTITTPIYYIQEEGKV